MQWMLSFLLCTLIYIPLGFSLSLFAHSIYTDDLVYQQLVYISLQDTASHAYPCYFTLNDSSWNNPSQQLLPIYFKTEFTILSIISNQWSFLFYLLPHSDFSAFLTLQVSFCFSSLVLKRISRCSLRLFFYSFLYPQYYSVLNTSWMLDKTWMSKVSGSSPGQLNCWASWD